MSEKVKKTQLFYPQYIFGNEKYNLDEAKVMFDNYVCNMTILPYEIKQSLLKIQYREDSLDTDIIESEKLIKQWLKDNPDIPYHFDGGLFFEMVGPIVKYLPSIEFVYTTGGSEIVDLLKGAESDPISIKFRYNGVSTGLPGFMTIYGGFPAEKRTPTFDNIYNIFSPSGDKTKCMYDKLFTILNTIGVTIELNGVEINHDIQKYLIDNCMPEIKDTDKFGNRRQRVLEIKEWAEKTFGVGIFNIYEKKFKEKNPNIKNTNDVYEKYDAFLFHLIHDRCQRAINTNHKDLLQDFISYVAKEVGLKILTIKKHKIVELDASTCKCKLDSNRYILYTDYRGMTISVKMSGGICINESN